jgi:RNA polymerase sigma-70 factor (ECF subfamily)
MNVGREQAFCDFVTARSGALLRTAYLLTGDRGQAEDLLQTALTKTYLSWNRIRDPGAVEAYVRRTMTTTATSWWRRRWHGERPSEDAPAAPDSGPEPAAAVGERDEVWRLLRTLPAKQRAVLVLRFYEDLSEAEIAESLGVSRGTVKSHTARAMAALRTQLDSTERAKEQAR